jgi:hypothetical protein
VAVNDSQMFSAMVEGMELVLRLITHYAIFESLYLKTTVGAAAVVKGQLTEALLKLYAAILSYLSKARWYYD